MKPTKMSLSKNKDTEMSPRMQWTTDELDQLSTILDEYQTLAAQRLTDLQQFYGCGAGFVMLLEAWIDHAATLRVKIERR